MKKITMKELSDTIKGIKGATFCGFQYTAPVEMKKTGNPHRDAVLTKTQYVSGNIGQRYDKALDKAIESEGKGELVDMGLLSVEVNGHQWGEHDGKNIIVNPKTGIESLQLVLTGNQGSTDIHYTLDGIPIEKDTVKQWLPVKKPYTKDGLETEIIVRDFRLDRISTIKIGGEEFEVTQ
jgi:hypothetical protein